MRRAHGYALAALCALAFGAPGAAAQEDGPVPPRSAAVAAGPVEGEATLLAFDHHGWLCDGLRGRRSSCGRPPRSPSRPRIDFADGAVYGVTTADVAAVDVQERGRTQTVATAAGAYAGRFAGQVRFFIAATRTRSTVPYRLRFRDAQGRVLGATDYGEAPPVGRAVTLDRGRVGGRPWRAVGLQTTRLAQTPLDLGRTERMTCVRVAFTGPFQLGGDCAGPTNDPADVVYFVGPRCLPSAVVVSGLVGRSVRRLDAVLGDGTRRRLALRALPAAFRDDRRAFALVVGEGIAVRSLVVRRASGPETLALRQAPAGAECQSGGFGTVSLTFRATVDEPPAGGGPLVARDQGDDLCVGLGAIAPRDCQLPPIEPERSRIERRRAGAQTAILAVVPPRVAAVRLFLDHGKQIVVPTAELPGYDGRYRGLVRAVAATLPGDRRLYRTALLTAAGRMLVSRDGPDELPLPVAPSVLARLPGGVTVAGRGRCVQVRVGAPTRDPLACAFAFQSVLVAVPCPARRIVVVARTRRPARSLEVVTDGGIVRGRRSGTFAVAIVAPNAGVRAVRLGATRTGYRLPPAARQCGYEQVL